ncbi:phage tail tape measure protein [Pseudomonas sp. PH1b]|uniref:phage tail tape measure protein n=1 Tax=Pseudomonas sp. PH1b TaxID=1397282 RepID=UPI00046A29BF|nr:phage tail tape measure protein [Pseudomonas sp. PH1b]
MATASRGSLQLDLGDLERTLNKAQRITDQGMRNMQLRVEEAGRKIAAALANSQASALDTTASAFDDLRKAYDPAARAADDFSKSQSSLNALLQQNKSAGTEYAQTLEASGKKFRAYSTELESLRTSGALAASQLGRGRRQQDLATQLSANDEKYALAREALDKQYPQGATQAPATYADTAGIRFPAGDAYGRGAERADDYAIKLDELKTKHSDMTLQIQSNYVQMSESLGDWKNGASSAWDDYMNKAGDVAAQSKAVFTSAFEQMDAAILQFATTGKFSFSDFAKSVLKDMAMLAAKTAASKALSSLFGMVGSAVMSLWPSAAPAASTFTVDGATTVFKPQIDASSLSPPVFPHAKGGAFTNTVATAPMLAPMALFGEAGPEAIMPLSRAADGSLGVVALGGGQSGTTSNQQVLIQQTINVPDGQAGASGAGMNSQSLANAYASAAKQGAAEQIARDLKPGGQIWSVINGR